ncbi:hypothetical protein [Deefgea rivuli]|uniref:hypothetical protein n=1 Tax=Deefgea rivuli TaxID=400948 RepID=UPI000487C601|nr:hypothetical protein [Deefgea rivuli]
MNRRLRRSFTRQLKMVKTHTEAMARLLAGKDWQEPPYSWIQIKAEINRYHHLQIEYWHRKNRREEFLNTEYPI